MRFTRAQYQQAIDDLTAAMAQLEPNGNCCSVCGDDGHMAWECGHNPLLAVHLCQLISAEAEKLHEALHWLAGHDIAFGVQRGPAKMIMP